MRKLLFIALLGGIGFGFVGMSVGQILKEGGFQLGGTPVDRPPSNAINDILVVGNDVWVGTGKGLLKTTDLGDTWILYTQRDSLGRGGVSALAERNDVMWVATAFDTTTELGTFPAGGGLSYSTDSGEHWHWIPQPVDPKDVTEYEPTTTNIQNLTYDIAITDSGTVWIASYAGGLRKSTDIGETWEVVTVDGYPFSALDHLTHRAFSVRFAEGVLWAGTAGGVHKSTDGGKNWTTFSHQNQEERISGNFVVAIEQQRFGEEDMVWAATAKAVDEDEYYGVSKTRDGGLTWTVTLEREFAHNFGFDSSTSAVYVATDNGLFKSLDFGKTWAVFPQIVDEEMGETISTTVFTSVAVGPEPCLWVGSDDGFARSLDGGMTWKVFRAYPVPGEGDTPKTYAYPNPFSPRLHNLVGGDGHVRFQYRTTQPTRVTVRVYDFGMNLVRKVVEAKDRSVPDTYSELWNGRNDLGDVVANGVYFYKITLEDEEPLWGKIMVVN